MTTVPRLSKSGIEYIDYSWGIYSGCLNSIEICPVRPHCWAESITKRFPKLYPYGFKPTLHFSAMESPLHLKKPSRIGVGFMGDLFCDYMFGIPEAIKAILEIVRLANWHTFVFLTKCPWHLPKFNPWPENAWVGASACNQQMAEKAIEHLRNVQANVRFISFEPLLGPIKDVHLDVLDWVIIGAQTKPNMLPSKIWVETIITAADKAGIPVFLKLNLNSEYLPDNAFNKDGLVRHELPKRGGTE